jgi:lipopolysaccharide/colanic/teichoic acid biosynthesis glycosyltransferase
MSFYSTGTAAQKFGSNFDKIYVGGTKRILDLTLVFISLPVTFPLMILMAAIGSLDGGLPLYWQMRVGKNGQLFKCWKLRSMTVNNEKAFEQFLRENPCALLEWEQNRKLRNDPRITKFGRFLRQTSLDELPQLWNILKGEMSLVGPRPIVPDELEKYGNDVVHYLSIRPGLTGLWQTGGRNCVEYDTRVSMDVAYRNSVCFSLDALIIARTFKTVLLRSGQ